MPEPRGSWAELWGKQFCADGGKARCCPKADVRDSGPSGFRSQKRTFKSGRADFDMATSAFEQHRSQRGRFQGRGCEGSCRCKGRHASGVWVPGVGEGGGGGGGGE